MWRVATIFFTTVAILSPVAIALVRSVVHRARERRDGLGGTQDVAMWGSLIGLAAFACAVISAVLWKLNS